MGWGGGGGGGRGARLDTVALDKQPFLHVTRIYLPCSEIYRYHNTSETQFQYNLA